MILFRVNVAPSVGLGHLMRCRTLAAELIRRGERCTLFGPDPARWRIEGDEALFDEWVEGPPGAADPDPKKPFVDVEADARAFVAMAQRLGVTVAVMDDYRISEPYQLILREGGLRWLMQYDASNKPFYHGDFVVNGSPYETPGGLKPFIRNPDAVLLLGPEYSVLRPAFADAPLQPVERPLRRVFVSFGGGDDKGAVRMTLDALADAHADLEFVVMSGLGNPNNAALKAWVEDGHSQRVSLHINPPDVPGLMASCDLAITGGGTMTSEAAYCGLPMLLMALADNQIHQCQGWENRGGAIYLGRYEPANALGGGEVSGEQIAEVFAALKADDARRIEMSRAGRHMVDGNGVQRLADHILGARR